MDAIGERLVRNVCVVKVVRRGRRVLSGYALHG